MNYFKTKIHLHAGAQPMNLFTQTTLEPMMKLKKRKFKTSNSWLLKCITSTQSIIKSQEVMFLNKQKKHNIFSCHNMLHNAAHTNEQNYKPFTRVHTLMFHCIILNCTLP